MLVFFDPGLEIPIAFKPARAGGSFITRGLQCLLTTGTQCTVATLLIVSNYDRPLAVAGTNRELRGLDGVCCCNQEVFCVCK